MPGALRSVLRENLRGRESGRRRIIRTFAAS